MRKHLIWGGERAPQINKLVGDYVTARLKGAGTGFQNFTSMGVVDARGLIGGFIYHNYDPDAGVIEISCASSTPLFLSRRVVMAMLAYPFDEIGCQLVVLRTADDDSRLHSQLWRLGFTEHEIPRLRGRNKGELVFTLGDDEWKRGKFMRKDHGEKGLDTKAA